MIFSNRFINVSSLILWLSWINFPCFLFGPCFLSSGSPPYHCRPDGGSTLSLKLKFGNWPMKSYSSIHVASSIGLTVNWTKTRGTTSPLRESKFQCKTSKTACSIWKSEEFNSGGMVALSKGWPRYCWSCKTWKTGCIKDLGGNCKQ